MNKPQKKKRTHSPYSRKPKIRLRVGGIYIRDNQILLVKHRKKGREYFLLPGGGQEAGETAKDSLVREWQEELGVEIGVGDLLFTGESVPPSGVRKSQVFQLTFEVKHIYGDIQTRKDGALVGWEWIPLSEFPQIAFFPACKDQIQAYINGQKPETYKRYDWLQ